jgi:hypothetical protein
MMISHLIIDDFLSNPDEVRAQALKLNYQKPAEKTYFPGTNSDLPLIINGLDEFVQNILQESLVPAPGTSHGKCRIAMAGEQGLGNVHIDKAHWSGILYLNKPEQCSGGTDFFRHIPTDSERAPVFPEDLAKFGYQKPIEVWDDFLLRDSNDQTKWEKVFHVPMRYNRLALFRPWFWHNAGPGFGSTLEDARLVMLFFYMQK